MYAVSCVRPSEWQLVSLRGGGARGALRSPRPCERCSGSTNTEMATATRALAVSCVSSRLSSSTLGGGGGNSSSMSPLITGSSRGGGTCRAKLRMSVAALLTCLSLSHVRAYDEISNACARTRVRAHESTLTRNSPTLRRLNRSRMRASGPLRAGDRWEYASTHLREGRALFTG